MVNRLDPDGRWDGQAFALAMSEGYASAENTVLNWGGPGDPVGDVIAVSILGGAVIYGTYLAITTSNKTTVNTSATQNAKANTNSSSSQAKANPNTAQAKAKTNNAQATDNKTEKKVNSKREAREAGKQARENQPESEKRTKDRGEALEKSRGKGARRAAHDQKRTGEPDRTKKQNSEDYNPQNYKKEWEREDRDKR